jgi:hypothetical protein
MCDSTAYCSVGDGGYAYTFTDSNSGGTSTATLSISSGSFCMSGNVEQIQLLDSGLYDYADDWGCGMGVNLNQVPGNNSPARVLTPSGAGITVSTTTVPQCTQARVQVNNGGSIYCAALTPGIPILWTEFNTACWDGSGAKLQGPPSTPYVNISFVTNTTAACAFNDFCVTHITFQ